MGKTKVISVSDLLTVAEYAKRHVGRNGKPGVTVAYVYNLIKKGKLETIKMGNITFIKFKTK